MPKTRSIELHNLSIHTTLRTTCRSLSRALVHVGLAATMTSASLVSSQICGLAQSSQQQDRALRPTSASTQSNQSNPASSQIKPDLILQAGHTMAINAVAFSPDGRWLASGSRDTTIKIWDTATGNVLRTIYGHSSSVNALAVSPDGKLLASGSGEFADRRDMGVLLRGGAIGTEDNTIRIWDVQSGVEVKVLRGHELPVGAVAFSNDGRSLISASGDLIKVWDVANGTESRSLKTKYEKTTAGDSFQAFLDMGNGKRDKQISERMRSFRGSTSKMSVSLNGQLVAIGLQDKDFTLYDAAAGRESRVLGFKLTPEAENSSLSLSPDARLVAYGRTSDTVSVQEASSGREVFKLQTGLSKSPQRIAFSPDGRFLITSIDVGGAGTQDILKLWDATTGQFLRDLRTNGDVSCGSRALAISPDNRLVATVASGSKVIRIVDMAAGKELRAFHTATTDQSAREEQAAFIKSIDPKMMAKLQGRGITTPEQTIEALEALGRVSNDTYPVGNAVSFTPDGRFLISRHMLLKSMTTECWNTSNGALSRIPNDVALQDRGKPFYSPDGRYRAIPYTAMNEIYNADFFKSFSAMSFLGAAKAPGFGNIYDQEVRVYEGKSEKKPRELSGGKAPGVGVVPAIGFSFDSKLIAMTGYEKNQRVILIYEASSGRRVTQFQINESTQSGPVATLAISADGRLLAAGYLSKIDILEAASGKVLRTLPYAGRITSLTFSPDSRFLVALGQNNDKYLWDASSGEKLATLVNLGDYFSSRSEDWLVVTPDGLFDGSPSAWSQILWQFGGNTFDVTSAETFFNEFYYPGLLGEIIAGRRPRAPKNIEQLDRRQPDIKVLVESRQDGAVSERNLAVKIEVTEKPADKNLGGSGARDLRLFRNGSLVKVWHGDVLKGQRSTTLEATIPIVAGENRLTAYAFNRDNVKSKDATVRLIGADSLKREGTCYILTVGLNVYENKQYNLQYAAADASAFAEELRRQQQKIGRYQKIEVIPLVDRDATKANILAVLRKLAGDSGGLPQGAPAILQQLKPAQPEDTIAIFYAGHGTTQGQRFYLIPHDLGYAGDRTALDAVGLQTILQHGISDEELERAVEGLDAGNVLMVIDACNSGQALEAEEKRRGPMNAKGLAQLAYEKGMYILTAAQAYQAALEAAQLGHGYLTYSLVEEGLKQMTADRAPKDNQVMLREWFDFATQRVPEMQEAKLREARRLGRKLSFVQDEPKKGPSVDAEQNGVQQPRVFYRRELEALPLIVAKP